MPFFSRSALKDGVAMREVWSWAAFDFANSGYTTVVLTAVFNAYFVSVVAGDAPSATFLWTVVIAVSNAVSMLLMPVIGTVADATATKKRWLAVATFMAVGGTLGLMFAGPGTIVWASLMIIVSNVAYNVGESLNSAFLPELAREDAVGKVSGWGWSFGYCGGILTLGLCLGVVLGGEKLGYGMDQTVAGTMAVTAFVFAAAALPIFLFLKERSVPRLDAADREAVRSAASESFAELRRTLERMGQSTMWANLLVGNRRSDPSLRGAWQSAVVAICDAAEQLSDTRTGALMVLERNNNLDEIIRTGTPMHADVIPEMLGTIFYEGTPLHDGAVVIRDGVIVAAGCVLPLSNNLEMGKDMGTRHRAGLGMSENSDAIVVIVSEETGIISMAKNGVLIRRLDRQNLFNLLQEEIVPPAEDEEADISPLQKLMRKGGALNHGKPE